MPRTDTTTNPVTKSLIITEYTFAALILVIGMAKTAPASELRPYSLPSQNMVLPSQNMETRGQYQQRQVIHERVDESFYEKFARDSKKYDAKKKARTKSYLKDKLKKSNTDAEVTHYTRLLNILNGR